ncbi:hypothetical protein SAMD00019534_103610 [Acytostelium subglobosum LB1]|uniref:hypothetical protein n=1 Tax=Acytostelium subglobosum LB1 TaxID=1410327 RepID=UPI000644D290|nr:hypothetical protein SAMD00019534_103610 [Acytostelium subglobosum LB1]GAM27186.1 hypothetical protein SAMD00019534_103610 [Acytostelium subglobosum LB1]|eukprot:XP_012750066.1 hypothetical protein SAMD00019534_103610 [Acytostelium subglobosum LB1]
MNKYHQVRVIGVGSEAKAILVRKHDSDGLYVIKQRIYTNLDQANEGLNEAMSMAKIQHGNIVKIEEVFMEKNGTQNSLCIVMEYCDGGDLMEFMINMILIESGMGEGSSVPSSPPQTERQSVSYSPMSTLLSVGGGSGLDGSSSDDTTYSYKTATTTTTTSTSTSSASMMSAYTSPPPLEITYLHTASQHGNRPAHKQHRKQLSFDSQVLQQHVQQQQQQYQLEAMAMGMAQQPSSSLSVHNHNNNNKANRTSWFRHSKKVRAPPKPLTKESSSHSMIDQLKSAPGTPSKLDMDHTLRVLIPSNLLYKWIYQLCLAVSSIHNSHFIHRDLKSENIFLSDYEIKIGDFGLATRFDNNIKGIAGTYYYSSPEVLNNQPYCRPADIFSLGCILYEMTTFHLLPLTKRCIAEELIAGTFDSNVFKREFPNEHQELADLVLRMLDMNPDARPSIDLILQNKLFDQFKKQYIPQDSAILLDTSPASGVVSTYSVSPQGGFRKQLDKSELSDAAAILAEAYSQDPRFSWIKRKKSNQDNAGVGGGGGSLNQSDEDIITLDFMDQDITDDNDNDVVDRGYEIRKLFFESALRIMYSERFLLWGYYNSDNILHGVACWISPDSKKRVPYGTMIVNVLSLLPKLGLKNSKRIKDLMDAIDRAMEKVHGDGNQYHLAYCGVRKESRSKGIGRYMLAPVLEWCDFSNRSCKAIVLKQRSIPFFMKLGFEMVKEFKGGHQPKGIDVIWVMERKSRPRDIATPSSVSAQHLIPLPSPSPQH